MNKLLRRIIAPFICAAMLAPGLTLPAGAAAPTTPYASRSVSPMAISAAAGLGWTRNGSTVTANWSAVTGSTGTYTVNLYKGSSSTVVASNLSVTGTAYDFTNYITNNGAGNYYFTVTATDGTTPVVSNASGTLTYFNTLALDSTSITGSSSVVTKTTTPTIKATLPDSSLNGQTVTLYDGSTQIGTGTVSGNTFSVTASALSSANHSISAVISNSGTTTGFSSTMTITVDTTAINISTVTLPDASTNTYYTQQLLPISTATSTSLIWNISSGYLPYGLTLSAGGLIYGYPYSAGTYTFTVQAASLGGLTATKTYTLNVYATPVIYTTSLPSGNTGTTYSFTLSASMTATWSVASGTLPAGLTLSATGVISGTPSSAGTYTFYVTAKNSASTSSTTTPSVTQLLSITVTEIPYISIASLQDGKVDTSYSQTLTASNTPTSWSMTSGGLPAGLSFDTKTGAISGTPTAVGSYTFTVIATNASGNSDVKQYTINIYGIPTITTTSLPDAGIGRLYGQQIYSANTPTVWSIVAGRMPGGMTLGSNTGYISGYPTAAGIYTFSVAASNAAGISTVQQLSIVVVNGSAVPTNLTVTGIGSATAATANIQAVNTRPSVTSSVKLNMLGATVTTPASYLNSLTRGNDGNWLQMTLSSTDTVSADITAAAKPAGLTPVSSTELDLIRYNTDGTKDTIQQLNGQVPVTINLTDAQVSKLKTMISPCVLYYDAAAKTLTDTRAVISLSGKTATFSTSRLGPFVIAGKVLTTTLGVTYRSYIAGKGWQGFVKGGLTSGTTAKSNALTAFCVKLTGNPSGVSVAYQTYLHGRGWQSAMVNGATSGTLSSSLFIEGVRISVTGIGGYKATYRVYQQGKGWQGWHTTNGGTAIASAAVAGSPGKGLRISAIQIRLDKVSA